MNESNTVEQLSQALNQLLDAYEALREENRKIKEENKELKQEVQDLEVRNTGLSTRLAQLTDTTKHHKTEMDGMLSKIEEILANTSIKTLNNESNEIQEENEQSTPSTQETKEVKIAITPKIEEKKEEEKPNIDLGRMQSLLNGFDS